MWFKNLINYQFRDTLELDADQLIEMLEKYRFSHCGPQDSSTIGWVPPMGDQFDTLVHAGSNAYLISARREERVLPATVVREALNEKVMEIEKKEDRKVGRKQKLDIRDELIFSMTPRAFTRSTRMQGLIMPELGLLIVDSSSRARAEEWISLLRQSLGSLDVAPIELEDSLPALFTRWLAGKSPLPAQLMLGEECLLQSPDDTRSKVHCRGQHLEGDEIAAHLKAGKYVTRLELCWKDSLTFLLNDGVEIKRLAFSDTTREQAQIDGTGDPAAEFDATYTLMVLELTRFLPALWESLGGLRERDH